eukprot:TRINITY_DN470_c0_g1_i2.p1 TRINITY_DN470_c0_g1~~TRINITY_DN470_c0_g1_i2.p1  ORF type:complete len:2366 (+),score=662.97 TRINITY_DN470_c0_g1_i2:216-7313(+)
MSGRGAPRGGRGRGRGGRGGGMRGGRGGGVRDGGPSSGGSAGNPFAGIAGFDAQAQVPSAVPTLEEAFERLTPVQLRCTKNALLNTVAASLIKEPRFDSVNSTTVRINMLIKKISFYDPEFPLKVALYMRTELNIRTTSNYVLSLSANIKQCTPFMKKYFSAAVRLPSDWLDVAATYQALPDKVLAGNAIPTALRKSMVKKFPEFDVYQLGKYNKEGSIKRKKKKLKLRAEKEPQKATFQAGKPTLTIKQMIRQLHISEPPYHVMCILGKKYPSSAEEFHKNRLTGEWKPELAGKRMKFPVPETWETLVSQKGNKASTWEELIEHKKLPFMAMLRNLRNLLFTGVHGRYHKWVMNKLTNEMTIAHSKQFPFRFFSAYEVIPKDIEDFKQKLEKMNNPGKAKGKGDDKAGEEVKRRKKKNPIVPAHFPTPDLFDKYRAALDTAVKLATSHNVKPIRGSTVVFCDVSQGMRDAPSQCGMGKFNQLSQLGILLGLMCKYVCEDCEFRVLGGPGPDNKRHARVELHEGSILDNVAVVEEQAQPFQSGSLEFPCDYLEDLIKRREIINNFIVLSNTFLAPVDGLDCGSVANIVSKYRQEVNPSMLFVSVNLSGRGASISQGDDAHPNDILVAGFSDSILRFIAERGDTNQLQYVEHIDIAHGLTKKSDVVSGVPPLYVAAKKPSFLAGEETPEQQATPATEVKALSPPLQIAEKKWHSCRVFISSTFLDMHGERDLLTRIIFPELRERCLKRHINLYEVDLRWGVTEYETQEAKGVEVCLDEVSNCAPFFVGLVGSRYGWAPDEYVVPDHDRFAWVHDYPNKRSVTELEMYLGGIHQKNPHAYFYFRHPDFLKSVPAEQQLAFASESDEAAEKVDQLKSMIRAATDNVVTYNANWRGVVDGKPMSGDLGPLAKRIITDLWTSICQVYPEDDELYDPLQEERDYHSTALESHTKAFVGRKDLLQSMTKFCDEPGVGVLAVTGAAGCGKSALIAAFAKQYMQQRPGTVVLTHFIGASPGSADIRNTLSRICRELASRFGLDNTIPEEYKDLQKMFVQMLEQVSYLSRLVLIIDALDQLDKTNRAQSLDWLPQAVPAKVIVTTLEGQTLKALQQRTPKPQELTVGPLEVPERKQIVQRILEEYHKKLDDRPMNDQLRVLLKKTDAGRPLYLVVACEELRVFGVYEQLTEKIKSLPPTMGKLFDEVLGRLEGDHGRALVGQALSVLACSRGGLREEELLAVLKREQDEAALPRAVWGRLHHALRSFLRPASTAADGGTIDFFHAQFRAAVERRYLSLAKLHAVHCSLAAHFMAQADPRHNGSYRGDMRGISELPYHLVHAQMTQQVANVLSSLVFIERKCSFGLTSDLLGDYMLALDIEARTKEAQASLDLIRQFYGFVSSCAHILAVHPRLTFQQAANQPDSSAASQAAQKLWERKIERRAWIKWLNKPQVQDLCRLTITGMTDGVTAAAFSSDGRLLVCASKDCTLKVFDVATGKELGTMIGHSSPIMDCCFSQDGRLIASAAWDMTAKVWDASSFTETLTIKGHDERLSAVTFTPDGGKLVTAAWDCTVRVWDSVSGEPWCVFKGHTKPVNALSLAPNGRILASVSWDGEVRLWDIDTKQSSGTTMKGHERSIKGCSFNPNGRQLVTCSADGTVRLWDSQAGKLVSTLGSHPFPVNCTAFADTADYVASASDDCSVRVWDAVLGKETATVKIEGASLLTTALSPDEHFMAAATSDCTVQIWDIEQLRVVHTLTGHTQLVNAAEYSGDGNYIATASSDGTIRVWDALSGSCNEVATLTAHAGGVNSLSFAPNGNRMVSASDDFTLIMWDTATWQPIGTLRGHTAVVKCCAYAPDGKHIVSIARDGTIRVWHTESGKLLHTMSGHLDWINYCAWSHDSKKMLTGAWDFNCKVWSMRKGKEIRALLGHAGSVEMCKYSPDDCLIVTASYDKSLKVWDAESGSEITSLLGHQARVNSFSFLHGGRLVSVSDDGTLKLWDLMRASKAATLVGHAGPVRKCVFSPKSELIATASDDTTVKIWDWRRQLPGKLLQDGSENESASAPSVASASHAGSVTCMAFSHDGELLATCSSDGAVMLWPTATAATTSRPRTFEAHEHAIRGCAFSPAAGASRLLATASDDATVKLWNLDGGGSPHTLEHHSHSVRGVAFSPDGARLVSVSWDCTAAVWDVERRVVLHTVTAHSDWVECVDISPDGTLVATGGRDKKIVLWELGTGAVRATLEGTTSWVTSVTLGGDFSLAAASWGGSVDLWDLASATRTRTVVAHAGPVTFAKYAPNGRHLITTSADHTLKLCDTATEAHELEFMAAAPCTTAAISLKAQLIACGDLLGNVYLLKYHHRVAPTAPVAAPTHHQRN